MQERQRMAAEERRKRSFLRNSVECPAVCIFDIPLGEAYNVAMFFNRQGRMMPLLLQGSCNQSEDMRGSVCDGREEEYSDLRGTPKVRGGA
mgnify:CR=1 FL=1